MSARTMRCMAFALMLLPAGCAGYVGGGGYGGGYDDVGVGYYGDYGGGYGYWGRGYDVGPGRLYGHGVGGRPGGFGGRGHMPSLPGGGGGGHFGGHAGGGGGGGHSGGGGHR